MNIMKVIGSSKIMRASAEIRNSYRLPAPTSTNIGIDLGMVLSQKNLYPVKGKIATLDLAPLSILLPGVSESFGDMSIKLTLLRDLKNKRIQIDDLKMHSFLGHFVFTEYKPKRFSATIFMMSEGFAAEKYRAEGLLEPIKGLSSLEALFAVTLITYEDWLCASPFAEYRVEHPRLGLVYQFSFGKKMPNVRDILNASLSEARSTPSWLHTLN